MGKALTALAVDKVKAGPARLEIPDGLLAGLYLVVQPTGAKSWAVRYRHGGRPRKLTLGAYPGIDLGPARELARKALVAVAEGHDPGAEKKAARRAPASRERDLFAKVAEQFIERYAKANTRPATWGEMKRILDKEVVPAWRGKTIGEISKRDVIELLDGIVDSKRPILANRTFAAVRGVFNWAKQRGIVESSPCSDVKAPAPEQSRDRVLSDDELRLVWQAAEADGWPFGRLVQMLILTGQRRDEVSESTWSEFNLATRTWVIPRERVKNNQEHEVGLSDQALAVLDRFPRIAGKRKFVFTTSGESSIVGFSRAKRRLDGMVLTAMRKAAADRGENPEQVEPPPRWTLHDLRRTVASGMARLGVALPVIEKILNHTSGSFAGIVGVYQRHSFSDEKRKALETWGRFVETVATSKPSDNVVALRA